MSAAPPIVLEGEERCELERIVAAASSEVRMVERARIVLAAADGQSVERICADLGCSHPTVAKWRGRFARDRVEGLRDAPRSGRSLTHGPETRALLIAKACTRPPDTQSGQRRERWTHRELAEQVGMSASQAHVILSRADIKPHRTESWVMTDFDQPEFEARAGEVCGLYLDPPAGALVLSIDEKTSIQAKGLARPDAPPAPGKPARRDYEYTRNGTMNLFAALRVHSGETHAMSSQTRNRFDLIRFLDEIDDTLPPAKGQQIIAIMDNLSTHKSKDVQTWLKTHPRWRFVFTPNHASWLNQVEIVFSIMTRRLLKHGHFDSPEDLAEQMLAYIETHNQTATPFNWTYTGKILTA
ncbi:MAG: IS630 family transposase [Actinobacteria bacterium]|nr:IS630 family transposase [Actinomycetota bacterium]